jgi:hypothetical protein
LVFRGLPFDLAFEAIETSLVGGIIFGAFPTGVGGRAAGCGLLCGGPPDFNARGGLGLMTGRVWGVSATGVGGKWIRTFGGDSSTPRIRISAILRAQNRTS